MKVFYSFPDSVGAPGIGVTAYHQVRGLVELGCDITLCCTHLARPIAGLSEVVETLTLKGRRIPHRAMGIQRSYAYHDRRTARLVPRITPDVVHCWPRATVRTAASARQIGRAVVREAPSTHTEYYFERIKQELEALTMSTKDHERAYTMAIRRLEEREYDAADVLLIPSEYSRLTFIDRGVPHERLALHQYGFDPETFPAPGAAHPARPFTAVFVGRCEPGKGLHYALKAWHAARVPGRFLICGFFVPGYRERLGSLLDHPTIEELGFVEDVSEVMRSADALVLPSVAEGSALVTYEAQASGCALLVSEAVGARCVHGRHGFVHRVGDVGALTDHLRALARDPARLNRMRQYAVAERDRLSWQQSASELLAIYRKAASRA